mgnify:CR=1 FL=1
MKRRKRKSHKVTRILILPSADKDWKAKWKMTWWKNIWKNSDKEALYNLIQNLKLSSRTNRKKEMKSSRDDDELFSKEIKFFLKKFMLIKAWLHYVKKSSHCTCWNVWLLQCKLFLIQKAALKFMFS